MDKQQKTGEHVENIKFCLDTQLNFMFSTYSPVFYCLSARGLDVSVTITSKFEVSLHFWQSWPTVQRASRAFCVLNFSKKYPDIDHFRKMKIHICNFCEAYVQFCRNSTTTSKCYMHVDILDPLNPVYLVYPIDLILQ